MYASYRRLPTIKNYAQALALLEKTKPIRGRAPTIYPLGDRRYADHFSIRKFGDDASRPTTSNYHHKYQPVANCGPEDVELLLYRNPVVVFHADDTITVASHYNYWSSADCHFMLSVLYKYVSSTCTKKGVLMLKLRNPDRTIAIPRKGSVRLKIDDENIRDSLQLITPDESLTHTVRLNRKTTNEVRKRYGDFYRYAKGMVGVRKEAEVWNRYPNPETQEIVKFSPRELVQSMAEGLVEESPTHYIIAKKNVAPLLNKPAKRMRTYEMVDGRTVPVVDTKSYEYWLRTANEYIELISAPQNDPDQYEKFARAFAMTALQHTMRHGNYYIRVQGIHMPKEHTVKIEADKIMQTIDGIVFRYHANEVFERVPAREGEAPSVQYRSWLDREEE